MEQYTVIDGKIYPKVDEVSVADLTAQRDMLIAAKAKADSDSATYQTQIAEIDAVLNQVPA